jgi:hypothetical protein
MPNYSVREIARMLGEIDTAPTADAKGAALEELSSYIFERVPGISVAHRNVLDGNRAHELDIVLWNDSRSSELYFLEAIVIVECKASDHRVGSHEVGWFVRKLQDRGSHFGILVALNGITGDGEHSAYTEVSNALIRDKIRILLLTREEIENLTNTRALADLLTKKFLLLTVKQTVHIEAHAPAN